MLYPFACSKLLRLMGRDLDGKGGREEMTKTDECLQKLSCLKKDLLTVASKKRTRKPQDILQEQNTRTSYRLIYELCPLTKIPSYSLYCIV